MAVEKKDPGKPGYMTTEFWAMIAVVFNAVGDKVGLSPDQVKEAVSSFPDLFGSLGDNPIGSVILGAVVIVYTLVRGWIKKTRIIAQAEIAMTQDRYQLQSRGDKPDEV